MYVSAWCTYMSYAQYYLVAFQLMQMQMADSKRKGRAVTKKRSTQQKLKVIKNANLMLLFPDSLTLCALTVVSQCVVLCRVVSRLASCVLSPLSWFFFCFGPSNCCRHHSLSFSLSLSCGPLLSLAQNRK